MSIFHRERQPKTRTPADEYSDGPIDFSEEVLEQIRKAQVKPETTGPGGRTFCKIPLSVLHALGYSSALHIALLSAPIMPEVRPDSEPKGPDVVQEMLARDTERKTENLEVMAELEEEKEEYIDDLLPVYFPEKTEGREKIPIPDESVYAQLEAYRLVIRSSRQLASLTELEPAQLREKIKIQRQALLIKYKRGLDRVLGNEQLSWTGDYEQDFPTLQEALFIGPDRFFQGPGQGEVADYYKDSSTPSEQLDGTVNCQVARFAPMVLEDVYRTQGLDFTPTWQTMSTLRWSDHVSLAVSQSSGEYTDFELFNFDNPAQENNNGRAVPNSGYLAQDLSSHYDLSERQLHYLEEHGYLATTGLVAYGDKDMPDYAFPLRQFEERRGKRFEQSDTGITEKKIEEAKSDIDTGINQYLESEFAIWHGNYERQGVYLLEFPSMVHNKLFRQYIIDHAEDIFKNGEINGKYLLLALEMTSSPDENIRQKIIDKIVTEYQRQTSSRDKMGMLLYLSEALLPEVADSLSKAGLFSPTDWQAYGAERANDWFNKNDLRVYNASAYLDRSKHLAKITGDTDYLQGYDPMLAKLKESGSGKPYATFLDEHTAEELRNLTPDELIELAEHIEEIEVNGYTVCKLPILIEKFSSDKSTAYRIFLLNFQNFPSMDNPISEAGRYTIFVINYLNQNPELFSMYPRQIRGFFNLLQYTGFDASMIFTDQRYVNVRKGYYELINNKELHEGNPVPFRPGFISEYAFQAWYGQAFSSIDLYRNDPSFPLNNPDPQALYHELSGYSGGLSSRSANYNDAETNETMLRAYYDSPSQETRLDILSLPVFLTNPDLAPNIYPEDQHAISRQPLETVAALEGFYSPMGRLRLAQAVSSDITPEVTRKLLSSDYLVDKIAEARPDLILKALEASQQ